MTFEWTDKYLFVVVVFVFQLLSLSDSLWPQALQHTRLPQSLLKFMPVESIMLSNHLILWCLILLFPSTFPASGSFPMSWLFASGDQNIGASASASVLPMSIQDWFPLWLTGLISLLSKGLFKSLLQHHSLASPFFGIEVKMVLFQYYGHCRVFQICWHIECRTLKASSFRILNSSTGIPSPSLALFIVMLPKPLDRL